MHSYNDCSASFVVYMSNPKKLGNIFHQYRFVSYVKPFQIACLLYFVPSCLTGFFVLRIQTCFPYLTFPRRFSFECTIYGPINLKVTKN